MQITFPSAAADLRSGAAAAPFSFRRPSPAGFVSDGAWRLAGAGEPRLLRGGAGAGLLMERRATNLIRTSEALHGEPWGRPGATALLGWRGVEPLYGCAPFYVVDLPHVGLHGLIQDLDPVSSEIVFSLYLHAGELTTVQLLVNDGGLNNFRATINVATGQMGDVGPEGAGELTGYGAQPLGSGWRRCWVAGRLPAGASPRVHLLLNSGGQFDYAGRHRGLYALWPQVELGGRPTSYVPSGPEPSLREADELRLALSKPLSGLMIDASRSSDAASATLVRLSGAGGAEAILAVGPDGLRWGEMGSVYAVPPTAMRSGPRYSIRRSESATEIWSAGRRLLTRNGPTPPFSEVLIGPTDEAGGFEGVVHAVQAYTEPLSDWDLQAMTR